MQKDIGYISHEELVFNPEKDIQSGGFSVSSIMMKAGISPIMTMNVNTDSLVQNGGSNKVSDLFQNLAVPNWATMYTMKGGEYKEQEQEKGKGKEKEKGKDKKEGDSDSDSDIDDDLHDKLLDLVKEHENLTKKKNNKSKRTDKKEKKNITKKNKKQKKEER
jgi:hypothetical protein